ncbi:unnamed protein product [Chrysoparadoxa australica]
MPHITLDMLRRKAEHNEGLIHTLEELSLHQEELERINEVLGSNCRKLQILYLQNNIIPKIENLHHMKELAYLNLALNNIQKIEGLGSCEFLNKLDLTVNFVDLDCLGESIEHLASRRHLRDLYMIGNPCQQWSGFESYVIALLPQLRCLDGKEITRSRRIVAKQQLPKLMAELAVEAEHVRATKAAEAATKAEAEAKSSQTCSGVAEVKGEAKGCVGAAEHGKAGKEAEKELTAHTPEVRTAIYKEMAEQKQEQENRKKENMPKERNFEEEQAKAVARAREREAEGIIRQCNEGKWEFSWDDDSHPGCVALNVAVPRFLDSSLIDLDVHPHYLSVVIKSKVLRLSTPVEVVSSKAKAQRAKTNGNLLVIMPKVNAKETLGLTRPQKTLNTRDAARTRKKQAPAHGSLASQMMAEAALAHQGDAVSIRGIVKHPEAKGEAEAGKGVEGPAAALPERQCLVTELG